MGAGGPWLHANGEAAGLCLEEMRVEKRYIGQRAHSAIQYQKPSFNTYYSCPFGHCGNLTPSSFRRQEPLLFPLLSAKLHFLSFFFFFSKERAAGHTRGASLWTNFVNELFQQQSHTDIAEFMDLWKTFSVLACSCSRVAGKYSRRLKPDPNTHSSGPGTTLPTALKTQGHVPSRKSQSFPFSLESCRSACERQLYSDGWLLSRRPIRAPVMCAVAGTRGPGRAGPDPPGRCPFPV